ncbi:MAG: polysaccharide biosynthesis protein, partial [Luteimonas sp.]
MGLKDRIVASLPRTAVVLHDLAMVWIAWTGLHLVRYALRSEPSPLSSWSTEVALVLLAQGLVFWRVGLYRGVWRFASVPDLINILKACLFGLVAICVGLFIYNRMDQVSRTVLVLYPFVLTALLGTPRLLYRVWKDHQLSRSEKAGLRVLILGAGQAGEALVRDLRRAGAYHPAGFLDDAGNLRGSYVQGIPVLGRIDEVERIARETAAGLLVIAMPALDAEALRKVVQACEGTGLPFR